MFRLTFADNQRRVIVIDDDQVFQPDASDGSPAAVNKDIL